MAPVTPEEAIRLNRMQEVSFQSLTHPGVSVNLDKLRWYAAYSCANHEKSVARQLELRSIESFLPLYERPSRWKDRTVKLQLPLFPGYVFVRLALEEKLRVLQVPGVVRLVGFNGHPAPLLEEEMQALREGLSGSLHAVPCPYLQVGRRVRIRSGALQGLEGILLKKKSGYRFVLSLELIQRSIAVEVDAEDLEGRP
jgi:transcription antitermination factor NusG